VLSGCINEDEMPAEKALAFIGQFQVFGPFAKAIRFLVAVSQWFRLHPLKAYRPPADP
jgi:hypothetical protein